MKCAGCGTENQEGSRFCYSCGTALAPVAAPPPVAQVPPPPPPPPRLFPKQPHQDLLGLLGLAFVLISLGIVFSANTSLVAELRQWGDHVAKAGPFVRPPEGVITSAVLFFVIVGLLDFVSAFLRSTLRWMKTLVLSRILSGVGDLIFAGLLVLYSGLAISGFLVLAGLVATAGVLLLVWIILGLYWAVSRTPPRTQAAEAGTRP